MTNLPSVEELRKHEGMRYMVEDGVYITEEEYEKRLNKKYGKTILIDFTKEEN